jgi:subtilisin-like proprotein convertase family protein
VASDLRTQSAELAIPDPTGGQSVEVTSTLDVDVAVGGAPVRVAVDIEHSYVGDLRIVLQAPSGARVALWNRAGGSQRNLKGTFGASLTAAESLAALSNEGAGQWKLIVADEAGSDVGTLKSWGIEMERFVCAADAR